MSFIGFASSRAAKHFINKWIDENVSDKDTARTLKGAIGFSISAGAIILPVATWDGAGGVDAGSALAEHLTDTGHDTIMDTASSYSDYHELDFDDTGNDTYDNTGDDTDDADSYEEETLYHSGSDIKFGGGWSKCSYAYCQCKKFLPSHTGDINDKCANSDC